MRYKSWNFGALRDTMIGFKLETKTTPKRYQRLEFQTLKDTTSTPAILLYKTPPGPIFTLKPGLHAAICLTDSFMFTSGYCVDF